MVNPYNTFNENLFISANYKGGQLLTLIGKGFSEETTATVCDEACMVEDWTVTQIFCVVPPGEGKPFGSLFLFSL